MEFEIVRNLLTQKLGIPAEEITSETAFTEDLGMDSLDMYGLVLEIEGEFEIILDSDNFDQVKTIADAIDFIRRGIDNNRGYR